MTSPFPQDLADVRRRPSVTTALVVFVGYMAVIVGANRVFAADVDFGAVAATADNVRDGVVLPVGLATLYLAVVTTALGWWRPSLREPSRRPSLPKWLWAIPVLAFAGPALDLTRSTHIDDFSTAHLVWMAVGFALVGFSEELMTRGLLVTGLRSRLVEAWVAIGTAVLFGLMHGLNVFFGQDASTTLKQVIGTIPMGLLFYMCRRVTGWLIPAMVIHALVDFSLVVFGGPDATLNQLDPNEGLPVGSTMAMLLSLVAIVVHRKRLFRSIDDAPR